MLEMLSFTVFVLLVGRLGTIELAATTIAFNINTLAFMPMIGFSIAVSTMVGQRLGENRPELAEKSTYSAFILTTAYMVAVAIAYVIVPDLFLAPFRSKTDPTQYETIRDIGVVLLRFVAFYSLFDTLNLIFAAAVKGAGDTRFVMVISVLLAWLMMVIPSYVSCVILDLGLYWMWTWATLYVSVVGFVFLWRFLGGKWKQMRVIEILPHHLPSVPGTDVPPPEAEV